ncbi:hypothetical protein CKA32_006585 [Geitlerinema sp. FC II]|nr:hypothetical protein CKA32_006585 [Geitlerinema sp. FC II]
MPCRAVRLLAGIPLPLILSDITGVPFPHFRWENSAIAF